MAETFHISKVVVPYPTLYVLFQFLLPLLITPSVAPTCQLFKSRFHLCLGLGVYSELASTFVYVKGIAEILHTSYIRNDRLFLVHLEEEFPLNELGYGRFHTFRSPLPDFINASPNLEI